MNSYATGDISTTNTYYGATGGLLGKTGNVYTTSAILNSYATGDIFASAGDVAGLAGYGYALITNSFATGNVMSLHSIPGRLVDTGSTYLLINTYKYDNQILLFDGVALENGSDTYQYTAITASSVQYNDIYFYLKHLGWNSYFFNFNTLDVENDDLPTHN